MRSRFVFLVRLAVGLVVVAGGLVLLDAAACARAPVVLDPSGAAAATARPWHRASAAGWSQVVFAQNSGDCGGCNAACAGDLGRCRLSQRETGAECALARACACQCRLNAGGCGFERDYLARCVQQSAAEAWSEMLAVPLPCGSDQRACATLSGTPLCVPADEACPR